MLISISALFQAITLRHRLIHACWESELLAKVRHLCMILFKKELQPQSALKQMCLRQILKLGALYC